MERGLRRERAAPRRQKVSRLEGSVGGVGVSLAHSARAAEKGSIMGIGGSGFFRRGGAREGLGRGGRGRRGEGMELGILGILGTPGRCSQEKGMEERWGRGEGEEEKGEEEEKEEVELPEERVRRRRWQRCGGGGDEVDDGVSFMALDFEWEVVKVKGSGGKRWLLMEVLGFLQLSPWKFC